MTFPSFIAPVSPALITSAWGADRSYRGEGAKHKGLDFRAGVGTPVYAVASGTVILAANLTDDPAGKTVIIDHGGVSSLYMHLDSYFVRKGDTVTQGQQIGNSGRTGIKESAPHLHFGLRVADRGSYQERYGDPPGGFGNKMTGGYAIPAEPFIPADYAKGVKERALALGIPVGVAAAGLGIGVLLLVIGLAWYFSKR